MANGNLKSRDELIMSNLGLVIKLAIFYKDRGLEIDELICEGNKGLITATTKFNYNIQFDKFFKGLGFSHNFANERSKFAVLAKTYNYSLILSTLNYLFL